MNQILKAIKDTLLSYSPARSQIEALMKFDFKIGDGRTSLMQLCFSQMASWPLLLLLTLIYFDPFKYAWSLVKVFSDDNALVLFLLDGRLGSMLIFFGILFVLEWVVRKEYLWILGLFYFLNRGELHVNLALVGVMAVYFSRICYLTWLTVSVESDTKKIWKAASQLQLVAWLIVVIASLNALDYLQINHLFNDIDLTRFRFLAVVVVLLHAVTHLFLSLWGHFYFQKQKEPSHLPVHYSSANWILRFRMSYHLRSLLKSTIDGQIEKHAQSQKQFSELRALQPGLSQFSLGDVLARETGFLKEANLRLTRM